jgi:1,4-alpha-glucan branching enzyme
MNDTFSLLARGRCGDPFSFLGIHPTGKGEWTVRAFLPTARSAAVVVGSRRVPMQQADNHGGWTCDLRGSAVPRYRLAVTREGGEEVVMEDPYRFGPTLDESRVWDFLEGREFRAHTFMGAHPWREGRVKGTRFAVWAPHARAVNVMGDMNDWDARRHPMRVRGATGVWELFVPGVEPGARYKYQVIDAQGAVTEKSDPFARFGEVRPASASVVVGERVHKWRDRGWMLNRARRQDPSQPMSVYEVHPGSWRRREDGSWMGWWELAETLVPYVKELGFTHIEFMPLTEHPLDQSWGYQPVGFFAPTSRFGSPDDLRHFVDTAHRAGLGVILDWVPGHFPRDEHGLVRFDGTPLFEHFDDRQAHHPDWGTLVFDYGKGAVQSFLISSALHWLEDFHIDGLRVDAVASMLYLDYSRREGEWTPNREGGNTNLEAVEFLRRVNDAVHREVPGALTVAEESTAWPGVSHSTDDGGLGFDQKWNMGWMNDTLRFLGHDPIHRKWHHDSATFSLIYAFDERFVLPLSHDEVVHGKGSLIAKMPGNDEERFANLRLLLSWQWLHPGKKLLFQGGELAQWDEWDADGSVDWALEEVDRHAGVRHLVTDLNRIHREIPALHAWDHDPRGFEWLDADDREQGTLSFLRWAPDWTSPVVVALNLTPVCRDEQRVPVPWPGRWRVVLNSDAGVYGGWNTLVPRDVHTRPGPLRGRDHAATIRLPGLAALVLEYVGE